MSTVVINLHPNYKESKRCCEVIEALKAAGITNVHNANEKIQSFSFTPEHVKAEQDVMVAAKHIVLVYPIYWYGMPAESKTWIDQTFTHGFAADFINKKKAKLEGKKLTVICTTGGVASAYANSEVLNTQP